jgi:hypothetical protein
MMKRRLFEYGSLCQSTGMLLLCKSQKGAAVQSRDTQRAVRGIYKKVILHLCESASEHSSPLLYHRERLDGGTSAVYLCSSVVKERMRRAEKL